MIYFVRRLLLVLSLLVGVSLSCTNRSPYNLSKNELEQLKEKGKIVAVTCYNSINYFIYRGEPMGFQLELLEDFASELGLKLEVLVTNNLDDDIELLKQGGCDIIAQNLNVTSDLSEEVDFTIPISQTRQVLVQRKSGGDNDLLVRSQLNLQGKTIFVTRNMAYLQRLRNLIDETGVQMRIVEVSESSEQLISMVSSGDIDYTVCDENIVTANAEYFKNIDYSTPLSFEQNVAWAVRKDSKEFLQQLNSWLGRFKKTNRYAMLYAKYFNNQYTTNVLNSDYFALYSGKISKYDKIIKKYSREIGWDWRLLASLICQESRFQPDVRSWAGAYGLMQLMPSVLSRFGVDSLSSPEANIRAGVQLIKLLDKELSPTVKNKEERIKFILASYNIGLGHIQDASMLAMKHGRDPGIWDSNVEYYLEQKINSKYYNDPDVKFGYCRGRLACNFVDEVLGRYKHYTNILR
jgi:membrane-bound lytic murein transglycosylase F